MLACVGVGRVMLYDSMGGGIFFQRITLFFKEFKKLPLCNPHPPLKPTGKA